MSMYTLLRNNTMPTEETMEKAFEGTQSCVCVCVCVCIYVCACICVHVCLHGRVAVCT